MREKGERSSWNYNNKILLLEAEIYSATRKNKKKAKKLFDASIKAAKSSKFVHEEGLACEFAAYHCLKHDDNNEDASKLLKQALDCYTKWGSQVKMNSVKRQLEKISATNS